MNISPSTECGKQTTSLCSWFILCIPFHPGNCFEGWPLYASQSIQTYSIGRGRGGEEEITCSVYVSNSERKERSRHSCIARCWLNFTWKQMESHLNLHYHHMLWPFCFYKWRKIKSNSRLASCPPPTNYANKWSQRLTVNTLQIWSNSLLIMILLLFLETLNKFQKLIPMHLICTLPLFTPMLTALA